MATAKHEETKSGHAMLFVAAAAAAAAIGTYLFAGPDGKKNRRLMKGWAVRAKGEVMEKVEALQEIDMPKYHRIVDTVVARYRKMKNVDPADLEKVTKELQDSWKQVLAASRAPAKAKAKGKQAA